MKKLRSVPVCLIIFAANPVSGNPVPDESITLETPSAGWRTGTRENSSFTQVVNYPASFVSSRENQSGSARIRGKIAGQPRATSSPATLIVNGVAMGLKVE